MTAFTTNIDDLFTLCDMYMEEYRFYKKEIIEDLIIPELDINNPIISQNGNRIYLDFPYEEDINCYIKNIFSYNPGEKINIEFVIYENVEKYKKIMESLLMEKDSKIYNLNTSSEDSKINKNRIIDIMKNDIINSGRIKKYFYLKCMCIIDDCTPKFTTY